MRKAVYSFILIAMVSLVVMGCAAVSRSIDYYEACKNDEACFAQMEANKALTSSVVHKVGDSTNMVDVLSVIAGNIASGLTGILLGKKLKRC